MSIFPGTFLVPGTYMRFQPGAPAGLSAQEHRALIIGLRLSTGTVAAETVVQALSASEAEGYHGIGSPLAMMVAAFKRHNPLVHVDSIGIAEDAGGTAATGTLTFAGTATSSGTIALYVGGRRVLVGVAKGDAAADVAAAAEDALALDPRLPATGATVAAVCTLTAVAKGAWGNDIDLRVNYYAADRTAAPAGITVTPSGSTLSGGATDPTIAAALAALPSSVRYDTIVCMFYDATSLTALEDELADRAGSIRGIPGQAFVALCKNYATTQALGDSRNSESLTIIGPGTCPATAWEIAASVAGIDSAVTDLNAPRKGLAIVGLLPPSEAEAFDRETRNLLLIDGVSTITVEAGRMILERVITTRQTTAGAPDPSYRDIGTRRVLNYWRADLATWSAIRFAAHKLGEDADLTTVNPGVKLATPAIIAGAIVERYRLHAGAAYVGNVAGFEEALLVSLSDEAGRADVAGTLYVLVGLHQIACDFTFEI